MWTFCAAVVARSFLKSTALKKKSKNVCRIQTQGFLQGGICKDESSRTGFLFIRNRQTHAKITPVVKRSDRLWYAYESNPADEPFGRMWSSSLYRQRLNRRLWTFCTRRAT